MRTYTVEVYAPPYPQRGRHLAVHVGSFEDNRDFLSPCLINAWEIKAATKVAATKAARSDTRIVATLNGKA